jgi:hypothetical protein
MVDNSSYNQQIDITEGNELSFGEVSPCRFDSINYNNENIDCTKSAIKDRAAD